MPEWVSKIAMHMKKNKGTALFLDYGYCQHDAIGDTLQALQNHKRQSPLVNIGQADLTHHVDFFRLASLFREAGLIVQEPISQGDFLKSLGLEMRTESLCKNATPEACGKLRTAAVRLTHPAQMGTLFKSLTVTNL
jgi:NADH dehydrogenase [ubiquinone] 1 alpha subcomplex assembly factor 7